MSEPSGLMKIRGERVRRRLGIVAWSRAEAATLLREGVSMSDIADAIGIEPNTLRQALAESGWGTSGEPLPAEWPRVVVRRRHRDPAPERPDYSEAPCVSMAPFVFDLDSPSGVPDPVAVLACKGCPVRIACYTEALSDGDTDHVFRAGMRWFDGVPIAVSEAVPSPRVGSLEDTVDEAIVLRRINGQQSGRSLTEAERVEIARLMRENGESDAAIIRVLRVSGSTWRQIRMRLEGAEL